MPMQLMMYIGNGDLIEAIPLQRRLAPAGLPRENSSVILR